MWRTELEGEVVTAELSALIDSLGVIGDWSKTNWVEVFHKTGQSQGTLTVKDTEELKVFSFLSFLSFFSLFSFFTFFSFFFDRFSL